MPVGWDGIQWYTIVQSIILVGHKLRLMRIMLSTAAPARRARFYSNYSDIA